MIAALPRRMRFNGDWVDRGRHQMEVMLLILSLKKLGARIWRVDLRSPTPWPGRVGPWLGALLMLSHAQAEDYAPKECLAQQGQS